MHSALLRILLFVRYMISDYQKNQLLLGKSIQCSAGGLEESYCWIQGLWTIREKENLYNPGTYVQAHPGVGAFNPDIHEKVIHRFYQVWPL